MDCTVGVDGLNASYRLGLRQRDPRNPRYASRASIHICSPQATGSMRAAGLDRIRQLATCAVTPLRLLDGLLRLASESNGCVPLQLSA